MHIIAMKFCVLWLLILATSVQVICQHWSYGLNPGGKRELHPFNQQTNVPVNIHDSYGTPFIHLFNPFLACGDLSPFAKLCRLHLGLVSNLRAGYRDTVDIHSSLHSHHLQV
uniref:Progonadoliberin n=1 Tax=Hippocampus comes TaxID=109280 RepID=A0A3Q2Y148_HIPCM